jgi:hypothetical protein
MRRSQFNLFYDIGVHLFGRNSGQALDYAMYFMERREAVAPKVQSPDPQRALAFSIPIEATRTTVPA